MTGISAGDALARMASFAFRPLGDMLACGPTLILAPHPDDESLGCGGLIAASCAVGQPPLVVIATDGAGSHPNSRTYPPERLRALRAQEACEAVTCLGLAADRLEFLGLPDTRSPVEGPGFDAAVARLLTLVQRDGIRTILATWAHDPHGDHASAHVIAQAVAARAGLRHWAYPVWGWTLPEGLILPGRAPEGWRLDITRHLPAKRRAIAAHKSQYAGLIADDPAGFQLPPGFVARFERPFETFLSVA